MKVLLSQKDVIWSYLGTLLSMGANFLMLPVIVYYLSPEMLGLWYVFVSLGAVATLFDFGFAVTFSRNITYCWGGAEKLQKEGVVVSNSSSPNFKLMKVVMSTCKVIYGLISGTAFLLLATFGTFYIMNIAQGLPRDEYLWAWGIYIVAVFLNLYYGYYASFLRGVGAVKDANLNTVIARALQIVGTLILLVLGYGIMGTSIAYLIYGTTFRLLGKYKFRKYHNIGLLLDNVKESASYKEVKEMFYIVWHNAWRDGIIAITNYFCDQVSVIICATYLTLKETGAFSLGTQIATAIAVIAGTLYTAYQPQLQAAYVNGDKKNVIKTMSLILSSYIALFVLGVIGVVSVAIPLLRYIKPDVILPLGLFMAICVYQFVLKLRNCYTSYFSCTNRIIYMRAFVASAIMSVVFSLCSLKYSSMGVWGIVFAQLLSQLAFNAWYWLVLAHKELSISFYELLKLGMVETRKKVPIFK